MKKKLLSFVLALGITSAPVSAQDIVRGTLGKIFDAAQKVTMNLVEINRMNGSVDSRSKLDEIIGTLDEVADSIATENKVSIEVPVKIDQYDMVSGSRSYGSGELRYESFNDNVAKSAVFRVDDVKYNAPLGYWLEVVDGIGRPLEEPTDYILGAQVTPQGARIEVNLKTNWTKDKLPGGIGGDQIYWEELEKEIEAKVEAVICEYNVEVNPKLPPRDKLDSDGSVFGTEELVVSAITETGDTKQLVTVTTDFREDPYTAYNIDEDLVVFTPTIVAQGSVWKNDSQGMLNQRRNEILEGCGLEAEDKFPGEFSSN